MNEHEKTITKSAEKKEKIRERYKGTNQDELEVIPAIEEVGLDDEASVKRVAVYVRVSTDDPNQTSSFELQKNHYHDVVSRHPGWNLIEIYADEGISGTSLNHRDEFVRMIQDCEAGKLDLIITKSVSRFARNVLDCIGHVRKLAALPHPVGVLFETENLYTLNRNSEMALSFISTLAQEESHTKSDIMNASIEMRFARGIFLTPVLLGYDQDEDGMLIINEDEAQTVRLCFFLYLYGYPATRIAETLMVLGRRTKPGNTKWTSTSILQILQNERYCGDVLAHKTYTPNYLDHKSVKNRQKRPQYRQKDHHEAIVSRDDFIAVQRLISSSRFGYKGCLPAIEVVKSGVFNGFIIINTKWRGFKKEDYLEAVENVCDRVQFEDPPEELVEGFVGDFDFRGFQVARGEYFNKPNVLNVTISQNHLQFSKACITKLDNKIHAELLFDPIRKLLAVRSVPRSRKHQVQLGSISEKGVSAKRVPGTAFLPTLFEIMDWDTENRYRIRGEKKQKGNESFLLFELEKMQVYIPNKATESPPASDEEAPKRRQRKSIVAYPAEWASNFGMEYYSHGRIAGYTIGSLEDWQVNSEGTPYRTDDLNPTETGELRDNITRIIGELKSGGVDNHDE